MKRPLLTSVAVLIAAVPFAALTAADTLEEVQQRIVAAASKLKSFSADMSMLSAFDFGGSTMKQEGKGTLEYLKKGETGMSRVEMKTKLTRVANGQETVTEGTALTIIDGEFAHQYQEQMGQKVATKAKADASQSPVSSAKMFESLGQKCDVKLLPDDKIDGADVYVIEATPKQQSAIPIKKMVFSFSKENGMTVRLVGFDKDGKPIQTTNFANTKSDPEIAADRFVFKAPEGVQVRDLTVAPASRPAGPRSRPVGPPPPSPSPATQAAKP